MCAVRLDNAGAHNSSEFSNSIRENGMAAEFSPPYRSWSIDASKRLTQEL